MKTETLDISQPELRLDNISTPDYVELRGTYQDEGWLPLDNISDPAYVEIHGVHQDDDRMLVECWRWYLPDFSDTIFFVEQREVAIA